MIATPSGISIDIMNPSAKSTFPRILMLNNTLYMPTGGGGMPGKAFRDRSCKKLRDVEKTAYMSRSPTCAASMDGLGTKTKVASLCGADTVELALDIPHAADIRAEDTVERVAAENL